MRTREEILEDVDHNKRLTSEERVRVRYLLEVLLDLRDMIAKVT